MGKRSSRSVAFVLMVLAAAAASPREGRSQVREPDSGAVVPAASPWDTAESTSSTPEERPAARSGTRSPGLAVALSLGGTAALVGGGIALANEDGGGDGLAQNLLMAGILAGPSLGYLYAGSIGRGLSSVGIRSGVLLGGSLLFLATCSDVFTCGEDGAGTAIALLTLGGLAVSAIHDFTHVDDAARRRNEAARREARPGASVTPTVSPADGRLGLLVTLRP